LLAEISAHHGVVRRTLAALRPGERAFRFRLTAMTTLASALVGRSASLG